MRHRKAGVKLNRTSSHRKAMFRNMVTSLLKHEKIQTTDAKAKAIRAWADHVITLAKRGDLHARRQAMAIVREKAVVHKLFAEVADKFGERNGGYTRITKLGHRPGDAAPISIIELITSEDISKKRLSKKRPTPSAKPLIADKDKETESGAVVAAEEKMSAADDTASVKMEDRAVQIEQDGGIEVFSPETEKQLEDDLSENKAGGEESEKSPQGNEIKSETAESQENKK